jgi:hypothetical protein
MIFQHTWQMVISGAKTQTRRLPQPNDRWSWITDSEPITYRNDRKQWQVGNTYAVQVGRGKKGIARIRIINIWQESDVYNISQADIQAEGFETRADFIDTWESMHGDVADAWVLEFELVSVDYAEIERQGLQV